MEELIVCKVKDVLDTCEDREKISYRKYATLPAIKPARSRVDESELNSIMSKVQNDISLIKDEVLTNLNNGGAIDYQKIQTLFERAENQIQEKKEQLLKQFQDRAKTLPISSVFRGHENSCDEEQKETTKDEQSAFLKSTCYNSNGILKIATTEEKVMALQKLKCIINPSRPGTRSLLNKHYGIPVSIDSAKIDGSQKEPSTKAIARYITPRRTKTTTAIQTNGRVTPPPPTSEDARKGVLCLIERKLIPVASRLTVSSSIKQEKIVLHPRQEKFESRLDKPQYNLALVKFDELSVRESTNKRNVNFKQTPDRSSSSRNSSKLPKQLKSNLAEIESIRTELALLPTFSNYLDVSKSNVSAPLPTPLLDNSNQLSHKLVIQNGSIRDTSQDFLHFKQYYCLSWQNIESFLREVEQLMIDYSVPIAFIDGERLSDLALFFETGPKPTVMDMLSCVLNRDDVETIINLPGRRYSAPDGVEKAAIKIQALWRCHKKRSYYLEFRRKKWSASVIALTWIMKCKMAMVRTIMKENQKIYLENYRSKRQQLQKDWPTLKKSKRLIIHIPSLGFDKEVRSNLDNIATLQNKQIGRIFDVKDPNVEVLYISPVVISEELYQYYIKLLEIAPEESPTKPDYSERLKILTPKHHNKFPFHNLSLSTLLKYSAAMMHRLSAMVKGRQAYIIPGIMHEDDLCIANHLDVPILGTEPAIVRLYSMKSGVRRIFKSASVAYPPGVNDVYSIDQVFTSLAKLVTENLHITRWLFKIDNERDGRGTAYCDVASNLTCYGYALKERDRYGDEWKHKWAHETTYNRIFKEIPIVLTRFGTPIDKSIYKNWQDYLSHFLRQGGIIEACPPSESVTGITTNFLIEPDGCVEIISVSDQVHSFSPYNCWGYTLPQSSIDPGIINTATKMISEACKKRKILGYCSVDFVTYINPTTDMQELWAVGLQIGYSDGVSLVQLMKAVTNGKLDCMRNSFEVTVRKEPHTNCAYQSKRKKSQDDKKAERTLLRHCVMSTNLFHSNLNNLHYSVFFQMCKARGIGFDDKVKIGTTFTLIDPRRRESMGMLTLGETLEKAVSSFAVTLSALHAEISSITMPGKSNFQDAINDLKLILESLQVNGTINHANYPTSNLPTNDDDDDKSTVSSRDSQNSR